MTNLTNLNPSNSYGDLLTTTNGGNGLTVDLAPLQDGLGNNSAIQIAKDTTQFLNKLIIPFGSEDNYPDDPQDGCLYFNTDEETLQIFYNNTWIDL